MASANITVKLNNGADASLNGEISEETATRMVDLITTMLLEARDTPAAA